MILSPACIVIEYHLEYLSNRKGIRFGELQSQVQDFKSKEDLNNFLLKKYGYGYWQFADSFVTVFLIYRNIRYKQVIKNSLKKIGEINKLRSDVLALLDDFLRKRDFYKYSKFSQVIDNPEFIWTPEEKVSFIQRVFNLDLFFNKLDGCISIFKECLRPPYFPIVPKKLRISPLNLLVLIWSFALRSRNRVTWGLMEEVLKYFWKLIDKLGIIDYLPHKGINIPSAERLRFIYNKYKKTDYLKKAEGHFIVSFKEKCSEEEIRERAIKSEGKIIDYSDPIAWLDEYLWHDKEPEGWQALFDMGFAYQILEDDKKERID